MEQRLAEEGLPARLKAAATGDAARRKELAFAAQRLLWEDGGYIIPYFKQTVDGASKRVQGIEPHVFPSLSWYRFWNFWLASHRRLRVDAAER